MQGCKEQGYMFTEFRLRPGLACMQQEAGNTDLEDSDCAQRVHARAALWTGLVVGVAYTLFARAMYRQQLAALQRELQREQHAGLPAAALPLPPPGDTPR